MIILNAINMLIRSDVEVTKNIHKKKKWCNFSHLLRILVPGDLNDDNRRKQRIDSFEMKC